MFSIFTSCFGIFDKKKTVVSDQELAKRKSGAATDLLLNKNFEGALDNAEAAIALDADNIDAHIIKGCALERLGKSLPAVLVFEEVLARKPDCATAKMELGYIYYRYENFKGAFQKFHEVCCIEGLWLHEAHFWRGVSAFFARYDLQAIVSLGIALEVGGEYEHASCGRLLNICDRYNFEGPEFEEWLGGNFAPVVPAPPLEAIINHGASYLLGSDAEGAFTFL